MKIKLRHKVIGLAICSALVPAIMLISMLISQQEKLVNRFDEDFYRLVDKDLADSIHTLWNMCYAVNEVVQNKVEMSIRMAQYYLHQAGEIHLSDETMRWKAENQATKEYHKVELPKMMIGGRAIEQNFNDMMPSHVVDELKALTNGTISLFQKMNENGDMLRIATTLLRPDGSRDIGQYIPVGNKEVDPEDTLYRVLRGETVYSSMHIWDEWYVFGGAPIRDSSTGNIIGMIRAAVNQKTLINMQEVFQDVALGDNGFVWVVRGHDHGEYDNFTYPHPKDEDYVKLNRILQEKGMHYFDKIKKQAIHSLEGEVLTEKIMITDVQTREPMAVMIKYTYFPQWDWVIGIVACEKDFLSIHAKLREPFSFLIKAIVWAVSGGVFIVILISVLLGDKIASPIADLTLIASKVADGDLSAASHMVGKAMVKHAAFNNDSPNFDETGQLFDAIRRMIQNLNSLISQVKKATLELVTSMSHITGTSKMQEGVVGDFRDLASEIAIAVNRISSTAQQLYQTMCGVSEVASESGRMADEGKRQIKGMEDTMQELGKATTIIANKLSVIRQKATNINSIVGMIGKVADQADILSVNASIEAEKAGEYGRGFGIVAREMGRLADQTTLATNDMDQMVKEMNEAIEMTVGEMEQFSAEVSTGVNDIHRLGSRFENIIEQVQVLSPRFESAKEGMDSQYQGAQKINQAMMSLTDVAKRTSDSLDNFEHAKESLNKAIEGLKSEMSQFNINQSMPVKLTYARKAIARDHVELN